MGWNDSEPSANRYTVLHRTEWYTFVYNAKFDHKTWKYNVYISIYKSAKCIFCLYWDLQEYTVAGVYVLFGMLHVYDSLGNAIHNTDSKHFAVLYI